MTDRQALLAREVGGALAQECRLPFQVVGRTQSDEEITLLMLQALRERSLKAGQCRIFPSATASGDWAAIPVAIANVVGRAWFSSVTSSTKPAA